MLAIPKVMPKVPERNEAEMEIERCFKKTFGAQMVPDFPKP